MVARHCIWCAGEIVDNHDAILKRAEAAEAEAARLRATLVWIEARCLDGEKTVPMRNSYQRLRTIQTSALKALASARGEAEQSENLGDLLRNAGYNLIVKPLSEKPGFEHLAKRDESEVRDE